MTTKRQQEVLNFITNHVNGEGYLHMRCAQIVTTSKWTAHQPYGMDSSNQVVKALFEQGLVEYFEGGIEYMPRQEAHYLVPRGFQHNLFGCEVGFIWRDDKDTFWRVTGFDKCWAVSQRINGNDTMNTCPRTVVAMKATVGEMVAHLVDTL